MDEFLVLTEVLDSYVVRLSALPIEEFINDLSSISEGTSDDVLRLLSRKSEMLEAVKLASHSLYRSAITAPSASKKKRQLAKNLLKYHSRMASRPTPFGTLSYVARGKFGYADKINLESSRTFYASVDHSILDRIITRAEENQLCNLQWRTNPCLLREGTRYVLPFRKSQEQYKESVSIVASEPAVLVLEACMEPIPLSSVLSKLSEQYPDEQVEFLKSYLLSLCKEGFLISELRYLPSDPNPIEFTLRKLQQLNEVKLERELLFYREQLATSQAIIQSPWEAGVQSTSACVTGRVKGVTVLQDIFALPSEVKEQVKVAAFLSRCAGTNIQQKVINEIRAEFIERYGLGQTVPFLKFCRDNDRLVEKYINRYSQPDLDSRFRNRLRTMTALANNAIRSQTVNVNLDVKSFCHLFPNEIENKHLPRASEIALRFYVRDRANVSGCLAVIAPVTGSDELGKIIGRFVSPLNHNDINVIYNSNVGENSEVDLVFEPYLLNTFNLAEAPVISNNLVVSGSWNSEATENIIPLNKVSISADAEKFRVHIPGIEDSISIRIGHSLNPNLTSQYISFLQAISTDGIQSLQVPFSDLTEFIPFIPRITVDNVVLRSAEWRLNGRLLTAQLGNDIEFNKVSSNQWAEILEFIRANWMIPRYCYIGQFDQMMLVDLDNIHHQDLVFDHFKKAEFRELSITEAYPVPTDSICTVGGKVHHSEVIFELTHSKATVSAPRPHIYNESQYCPSQDWIYVKLYCQFERREELLLNIRDMLQKLSDRIGDLKWFFIQYVDPDFHIRLRVCTNHSTLKSVARDLIEHDAFQWYVNEVISRFTFDMYFPETPRYGGLDCIALAEEMFRVDSVFCLDSLDVLNHADPVEVLVYATSSAMLLVDSFALTDEELNQFISPIYHKEEFSDDFRAVRQRLQSILNAVEYYNQHEEHIDILISLLDQFRLIAINLKNKAANSKVLIDVVHAIVHMHFNRFVGPDRQSERKCLNFVARLLSTQSYWRKVVHHDASIFH